MIVTQGVAEWVVARCKHLTLDSPYTAIGWEKDGQLAAGVVYDNYTRINIDAHIALVDKWSLKRQFLGEIFRYPFLQLGVQRITTKIAASNWASRKFNEHLGFTVEGRIRQALPDGEDLIITGMLRWECRWLRMGKE